MVNPIFPFCVTLASFSALNHPCLQDSLLSVSSARERERERESGGESKGEDERKGILLASKCHLVNGGAGSQV